MFRSLSNWQKGVIFYVLTLIMAIAVVIFGPDREGPLQILNMLTPTVGVLLLLLVVTPDGYHRAGWAGLALHRPGWRAWPLALIAPTAILCVSYGVAWLVGVLSWNFESDILINLIIAILINSVFAIFEEIGWRGYLLPHFGAPGSFGAALLVGFLHGVWHLPLMLMTTAYNPAGNRLITVPIFLAVLTGAGVIYAYLRWTSGSIWPVIIAHGTFNAVLGSLCRGGRYPRCRSRRVPHRRDRSIHPWPGSGLPHLSWPDVTDQLRSTESDERRTQTGEHLALNRRSRRSQAT